MARDDDYRKLIGDAERAVHELLSASGHDEWISLRSGYGELRREARRHDAQQRSVAPAAAIEDLRRRREAVHARWADLAPEGRENLLLEALGEDRLLVRELADRMNALLVPEGGPWRVVYEGAVRGLVTRLLKKEQLDRIAEPWRGRVRYRYYRRRGLSGPIADLDRAFYDD